VPLADRSPARVLPATDTSVAEAARILRAGGLVAFPTETVYGLGADASQPAAVQRIFTTKGRPADHPLIVHLAGADLIDRWAVEIPDDAQALAAACWPGPLTLVLRRHPDVSDAVTGRRPTVGLRVPDQPVALALLERAGTGVAAPSANRFGRVSPTTAQHVADDLGPDVDLVLDGGACAVGVESTIVELTGAVPTILRAGGVSAEELEAILGRPVERVARGPARAPGMLAAHYAPAARVVLVDGPGLLERAAEEIAAGHRVGVLSPDPVGPGTVPDGVTVLEPVGDAEGYARHLYDRLRRADRLGLDVLLAVPPPSDGIGLAVVDRLRRAAASR
jgi:L-threonylcarbamoyladenylate synthase